MNLKPFWAWCASKAIQTPLDIRLRSDGSRYTVLRRDEKKQPDNENNKTLLIQCPLDACLRAPTSEELVDRLVHEVSLGRESDFEPYLATLPKEFPDFPRFWSSERLESVTDGGFLQQAMMEHATSREEDFDAWAQACVDSRANFLQDGSYALTPVLDMINHDGHTIETSAAVSGHIFTLEAKQQQPNKEEICISYGNLTNLQTLLNYGFVQRNNPHNTEFVRIYIMGHAPVTARLCGADGSVDAVSLGMLRKHLATDDEQEQASAAGLLVPVVSQRNEVDTQALIASFIEEAIEEAATTTITDDPLVATYLHERAVTLQVAKSRIEREFPEAFG